MGAIQLQQLDRPDARQLPAKLYLVQERKGSVDGGRRGGKAEIPFIGQGGGQGGAGGVSTSMCACASAARCAHPCMRRAACGLAAANTAPLHHARRYLPPLTGCLGNGGVAHPSGLQCQVYCHQHQDDLHAHVLADGHHQQPWRQRAGGPGWVGGWDARQQWCAGQGLQGLQGLQGRREHWAALQGEQGGGGGVCSCVRVPVWWWGG